MKPLTIEELKALPVGDWVWIVDFEDERNGFYFQLDYSDKTNFGIYDYSHYGKTWVAYKNKGQAEGKEDEIRKQIAKEILRDIFSNETCGDLGEFCNTGWVISQSEIQEYFKKYGVEVDE